MSVESDLGRKVAHFLTTDPIISKINFTFLGRYRVTPDGYRKTVANAYSNGDIKLGHYVAKGAAASYRPQTDSLELAQKFDFKDPSQLAVLLHECTHTLLDLQNLGKHSRYEEEAVAYTAQAMYETVTGKRNNLESVAPNIYKFMYLVANGLLDQKGSQTANGAAANAILANERALVHAVATHPHYQKNPDPVDSNALKRNAWWSCLRTFPGLYSR